MRRRTLIVTCAAPDAVPFLRGLPADELEQAALIVTPHLAGAIEEQRMAGEVHITAGVSTLGAVQRVAGCSRQPITIVIGPDPGNPFRCKGLVRARLLAPWALSRSGYADLVQIESGGGVNQVSTHLSRRTLLRTIYVRESLQLGEWLMRAGGVIPMTMITLAQALPFIAWTEARARFMWPRS